MKKNNVSEARKRLNSQMTLYGFMLVLFAGAYDIAFSSDILVFGFVLNIIFIILIASLVVRYIDFRFSLLEEKSINQDA